MSERFDVAIVGGGPAGSSCAWRLTQAGANVVVIDQSVSLVTRPALAG